MGDKDLPRKKKHGLYHILTDELRLFDKEYFFRFVRMTPQRFELLLSLVGPISPAERLVLTLRFLALDDWQKSQSAINCSRIGRNFRRIFIQIYFTS